MIGNIKSLQPTFGFIHVEDGRDFFFHDSDLLGDVELALGDRVTFEIVEPQPPKGPRARDVAFLSGGNQGGMNERHQPSTT